MYLHATDNGVPTTLYSVPASDADGKDLRLLGLMIRAARVAESEDFCYQYDRIAEMLGTWTRDDLREAGLLDTDYTVTGTRTVTLTVNLPFSFTANFASAEQAEQADPEDYAGEVTRDDLWEHIRYNSVDWEVDETEVSDVERA